MDYLRAQLTIRGLSSVVRLTSFEFGVSKGVAPFADHFQRKAAMAAGETYTVVSEGKGDILRNK